MPGLKPAHGPQGTGEANPRTVVRRPAAWPSPQARPLCERDAGARPPRGYRAPASRGGAVTVGEPVP
jgi:hypothetical protein